MPPAVQQGELDVLERRGSRQQVESLEDEPDLLVAHARELALRQLGHVAAVEPIGSGRRPIETPEQVHEGGLPRPGGPGEGDELSRLHVERDAAQRSNVDFADVVGPRQVADGNERLAHLLTSSSAAAIPTTAIPAAEESSPSATLRQERVTTAGRSGGHSRLDHAGRDNSAFLQSICGDRHGGATADSDAHGYGLEMSISDDPHLAGRAPVLTGCGTAKTHIALAAIVSSATPTGSPASSASPVTASPVTASPAATAPSASSSGKERLTFLRRHLLQSRAKRLALVVTPPTALATGVGGGSARAPHPRDHPSARCRA